MIQPLPELEKGLNGRLERISLHGKTLEGISKAIPRTGTCLLFAASYDREPERQYPVVYTLHGYGLHAQQWVGFANVSGLEKGRGLPRR